MNRLELIAYAALFVLMGVLAYLAWLRPYFWWDLQAARWLQGVHFPGFKGFMEVVGLTGRPDVTAALFAVAFFWLWLRRWRKEGGLILLAAFMPLLNMLVKQVVDRPRPTKELLDLAPVSGAMGSFPSGHAFASVVLVGMLYLILSSRIPAKRRLVRASLLAICVLYGALMGVSRVYLVYHWPSDVMGGYLLACLALAFLRWVYLRSSVKRESGPL